MKNPCINDIRIAIKNKYNNVAHSAEGIFNYPTGRTGLLALGYNNNIIAHLPDQVVESFCGVGNPFSITDIEPGETILDIGSGAGLDVIYASHLTGYNGKAYGIDLTPEMVEKAQKNISLLEIHNANVQEGTAESIPFSNETFDVVTSNGVLNLSPQKEQCFTEIYRVLKQGGRIQFADIILEENYANLPSGDLEAWSNWIGGAIPGGDVIKLLTNAGFKEVKFLGTTGTKTSKFTIGAVFLAKK